MCRRFDSSINAGLGHVRFDDPIDPHPLILSRISIKRHVESMPYKRPTAICSNYIFAFDEGRLPCLRIFNRCLDPVPVSRYRLINLYTHQLNLSFQSHPVLPQFPPKYLFLILLSQHQGEVPLRVLHILHKIPSSALHLPPILVIADSVSARKTLLSQIVRETKLVKHFGRSRIQCYGSTVLVLG